MQGLTKIHHSKLCHFISVSVKHPQRDEIVYIAPLGSNKMTFS